MDCMPFFFEKNWAAIKVEEQFNLPDMRVMAGNYRCNEIKDEAYRLIEG